MTFSEKELYCIGCESKPFRFCKFLSLSPRHPQTTGHFLQISIARRNCLCVSGKVVLWSIHKDIENLVPLSHLTPRNYIYRPSPRQREATGGHGRPREATGGPLEATEASSRAQILARHPTCSPLSTPPRPLKLCLFRE